MCFTPQLFSSWLSSQSIISCLVLIMSSLCCVLSSMEMMRFMCEIFLFLETRIAQINDFLYGSVLHVFLCLFFSLKILYGYKLFLKMRWRVDVISYSFWAMGVLDTRKLKFILDSICLIWCLIGWTKIYYYRVPFFYCEMTKFS